MTGRILDWRKELERWLRPFLERLGHKTSASDVSGLYIGADRSRRPQEHSADGRAYCAWRI